MAKNDGFTRTSVSLSADLKRRMDKVKEPVNWSAVASAAFEAKLGEIAARKEKKEMSDVVQRLRASKQQAEGEQFKDGLEYGQEWARDSAEAPELERLERFYDERQSDSSYDWQTFFSDYGSSAYSSSELLFFVLVPEANGDRTAASDFWEAATGDAVHMIEQFEWLRGFAEGALDVWGKVKGQL